MQLRYIVALMSRTISVARIVFVLYLIVLLWLVLFKFSFDFSSVLNYHAITLNLIPFADYSQANAREMIYNFIVFIPFGLLFSVNFKRTDFWHKLIYVFFFSLAVEMLQFMLAIGVTDITDVITNTLGGLVGLSFYSLAKKYINEDNLDRFIIIVGIILLVIFILLRTLVLRVSYHSAP